MVKLCVGKNKLERRALHQILSDSIQHSMDSFQIKFFLLFTSNGRYLILIAFVYFRISVLYIIPIK